MCAGIKVGALLLSVCVLASRLVRCCLCVCVCVCAGTKVGALLLSLCADAGLYVFLPRLLAPLIPKDAGAASSMPAVHSFLLSFLPSRIHEFDATRC